MITSDSIDSFPALRNEQKSLKNLSLSLPHSANYASFAAVEVI